MVNQPLHKEGYFEKNDRNVYVINDRNGIKGADGSVTDTSGYFGEKGKIDPIQHLLGTA